MSFILDALKKSDSKRQGGAVPKLETVHQRHTPPRKKRLSWRGILLLVLILNAAVLLWLFAPGEELISTAHNKMEIPTTPSGPAVKDVKRPTSAKTVTTSNKEQSQPTLELQGIQLSTPAEPTQEATQAPAVISFIERPLLQADPAEEKNKIPPIEELPASLREDIPEMHMSVHAYYQDNPSANLIRINGQIMRTGDQLSDKYLLEEITSEGAVFRYAGYRYLVPRKNRP